jgi:hypothetical protein
MLAHEAKSQGAKLPIQLKGMKISIAAIAEA